MKIIDFIKSVFEEFKKIEWPSRPTLFKYSWMVIIFIAFSTLFIAAVDFLFIQGRTYIINNL